jgi:hypothetical protein
MPKYIFSISNFSYGTAVHGVTSEKEFRDEYNIKVDVDITGEMTWLYGTKLLRMAIFVIRYDWRMESTVKK